MKYTLLELTQIVLSSIDGDEVNSISDTVESQQVVKIIKRVYGNLAKGADYPNQYGLFSLDASGDNNLPAVMYIPSTHTNMGWLKYNAIATGETDDNFQPLKFVDLPEFLLRMHALVPSEDNTLETMTVTVGSNTYDFIVRNDKAPEFYTTIDDDTLIFDSYDSAVDTTLQNEKTIAYGEKTLSWTLDDGFDIPIPDHQLLLNESIALAWAELKQSVNAKAEQTSRQLKISDQRKKHSVDPMEAYRTLTPNYGRK